MLITLTCFTCLPLLLVTESISPNVMDSEWEEVFPKENQYLINRGRGRDTLKAKPSHKNFFKSLKILTAFAFCTLNVESSLDLWKGKDLIYVIFNSSWDKGGIISNAGKVTTDKHLMGEGNRRSLGSKKLVDHSFRTASEPEL